jgi:hypothetical protein
MMQHFQHLEKIAVKSVHSTKLAITSIIEITNCLGSLPLASAKSNLHATTSAIDKARNRHLKHSLQNASALNCLKRKSESMPDGKVGTSSNTLSKKKQSNCTICRDIFKVPKEIYSTHRGNSLKCPNNKNNMPSKNSQLDLLKDDSEQCTQNSTVAVDNNDKETAVDNN